LEFLLESEPIFILPPDQGSGRLGEGFSLGSIEGPQGPFLLLRFCLLIVYAGMNISRKCVPLLLAGIFLRIFEISFGGLKDRDRNFSKLFCDAPAGPTIGFGHVNPGFNRNRG
jgi:hypothetical protein